MLFLAPVAVGVALYVAGKWLVLHFPISKGNWRNPAVVEIRIQAVATQPDIELKI
jgi:hypothetical protein